MTVPGALHGWAETVARYGSMSLEEIFEDAIYYAENGFPVTEIIAGEWKNNQNILVAHTSASQGYLIDGTPPRPGQVFQNKDLARTFRKITRDGIESFYEGEICEAIVNFSQQNAGLLSKEDFRDHTTTWVEPIATDYHGYTVFELPPNVQGVTALEMLNILEGYDMGNLAHNGPEYLHLLIEAKKIAFSDRDAFVTDPEFKKIPVETMISKEYAAECRLKIDPERAMNTPPPLSQAKGSNTVFVTAVDQEQNAVSFISSIYLDREQGVLLGASDRRKDGCAIGW